MNDKMQMIAMLREVFHRWRDLLAGMSDEQITALCLSSNRSIRDVIAHLWAWQQLSIARMEAARLDQDPEFVMWPVELDPESADGVQQINAWIYQTYHERSWPDVYRDWQGGFSRFLELAEAIPEKEMLDPQRYAWLEGYPLFLVLQGSHEHHQEHLDSLLAWLEQCGDARRHVQRLWLPPHFSSGSGIESLYGSIPGYRAPRSHPRSRRRRYSQSL